MFPSKPSWFQPARTSPWAGIRGSLWLIQGWKSCLHGVGWRLQCNSMSICVVCVNKQRWTSLDFSTYCGHCMSLIQPSWSFLWTSWRVLQCLHHTIMRWLCYIISPSLCISFLYVTPSKLLVSPNYFCSTFIVYMACLPPLFQTETIYLKASFGRNYYSWLMSSSICLYPTILNLMVRHSDWINLWKHSYIALSMLILLSGLTGFTSRNFGTTLRLTPLLVTLHLLLSTVMSLNTSVFTRP